MIPPIQTSTSAAKESPATLGKIFAEDPSKLTKILRLTGKWASSLFSFTPHTRTVLSAVDDGLKQTHAIVKLVFFLPSLLQSMTKVTSLKETILKWFEVDPDSKTKVTDAAQNFLTNTLAPAMDTTADVAESLHLLKIVDLTPIMPILQIGGGSALLVMGAKKVYDLAKRYFHNDTGGTFYLEALKQIGTLGIGAISIAAMATPAAWTTYALLMLGTAHVASSLSISIKKHEQKQLEKSDPLS